MFLYDCMLSFIYIRLSAASLHIMYSESFDYLDYTCTHFHAILIIFQL